MTNKQKIKKLIDIAKSENVIVERGNMIRWDHDANRTQYRYNIKKNVIRFEIRSMDSKLWTRINSHKISDTDFDVWKEIMQNTFKNQR